MGRGRLEGDVEGGIVRDIAALVVCSAWACFDATLQAGAVMWIASHTAADAALIPE